MAASSYKTMATMFQQFAPMFGEAINLDKELVNQIYHYLKKY